MSDGESSDPTVVGDDLTATDEEALATGTKTSATDEETRAIDQNALATDRETLAAIVRKPRGDAVLAALRDEGVYDDGRRIVEHGDGTLAIPVTEPPDVGVVDVIRQRDPERRPRDLDQLLRERGWSDNEIDRAPSSWAVLGTVVLVTLPEDCPDETALGDALLELHGNADTVLAREGVEGQRRQPRRRVIAGMGDSRTVHEEHGIRYAMDLSKVIFSPGNKTERARMAAVVAAGGDEPAATVDAIPDRIQELAVDDDPTEREQVFDMFAGIGYFTLPMAVASAQVTAAEINSESFRFLVENARLNDVGDRVSPYLGDCREVDTRADRIVMGHYDAAEYLDTAFAALRPGGVVHYHAIVPESELWGRPIARLEAAADAAGRGVEVAGTRRVKSYGEAVWHVVVDARIS